MAQSYYGYDGAGEVNSIDHQDASANAIQTFDYAYDLAGRLTTETTDGTPKTYAYRSSAATKKELDGRRTASIGMDVL